MHMQSGIENGFYLVQFQDTGAVWYRADLRAGVWYWRGGVLPMTARPCTWMRD